ncbi:MAG: prepilin-type N-terminal cleavage/methylation protein [Bacteroidota bacterium]|jgi:type IV pilus assembly protein PilE|nr:prepilin-type N-terminal cleavage/methylation protein [Bacteroidota bacterium]
MIFNKNIKRFKNKKLDAFTMFELLVAMAIIGILSALAVPEFLPLIGKSKAQEAKLQLRHVLMLEKQYFYVDSKYTTNLEDIGFEQAKLVTADGNANYKIEITDASVNSFTARATAVADFDGDGQFNVWQITADEKLKEVTPD